MHPSVPRACPSCTCTHADAVPDFRSYLLHDRFHDISRQLPEARLCIDDPPSFPPRCILPAPPGSHRSALPPLLHILAICKALRTAPVLASSVKCSGACTRSASVPVRLLCALLSCRTKPLLSLLSAHTEFSLTAFYSIDVLYLQRSMCLIPVLCR